MSKTWRPENWENPYICSKEATLELVSVNTLHDVYEKGAEAMWKVACWAFLHYESHEDEAERKRK